jgi:chemotaxis methyl-accepting protein methylase
MNTNPELIHTCRELLCVSTGEFFRDVSLWIQLKNVFKKIAVEPKINILFSRVSTGEELCSLFIFLQEQNLLEKTTVHATEICNNVLQQTKRTTYNIKTIENTQKVYQEIGFSKPALEYFDISGNMATLKSYLMNNCTFFIQDIHTPVPNTQVQYDLIWYRNQLIYWDTKTANEHLTQFADILKSGGYLLLGYAENLDIYPIMSNFETVSFEDKIYRKK